MDNELRVLLQRYLSGEKSLEDLSDWVALNIWDSPSDADSVVDHLAIELAHLDDQITDEQYFREQIVILTSVYVSDLNWGIVGAIPNPGEGSTQVVTTSIVHIQRGNDPLNPSKPITAEWSFA